MYILGLNSYGHDSSVCLLKDGVPVFAACEERFNRQKHYRGFPELALRHCLREADISFEEIEYIGNFTNPACLFPYGKHFTTMLGLSQLYLLPQKILEFGKSKVRPRSIELKVGNKRIYFIDHHLTHAASSFFVSGFEEAAILSVDSAGETVSTLMAKGSNNNIEVIKEIDLPHSLGILYTAVTEYLGFRPMSDEGKVMGLAPYGEPSYYDAFKKIIDFRPDGDYRLDMSYFSTSLDPEATKYSERFVAVFGPPRELESEITKGHEDIASSLQLVLEEGFLHLANYLHQVTGLKNLCLAGGVALNSVANARLLKETPFEEIFVQPAASDAGCALGAAYYIYHALLKKPRKFVMKNDFLGPAYQDEKIRRTLKRSGLAYEQREDIFKIGARLLSEGKIIGWFCGRMEFGPRALGARSILADPRGKEMKDKLNFKVKHREGFRPFAPSVLEERVEDWFELDYPSPFMLLVYDVLPRVREKVPAITHVDGTGRVQTVNKETNPKYYHLIKEFENLTGIPLILNTSFNVRGEPIVCSPQDAVNCFKKTGMDYLIIEDYLVCKSP